MPCAERNRGNSRRTAGACPRVHTPEGRSRVRGVTLGGVTDRSRRRRRAGRRGRQRGDESAGAGGGSGRGGAGAGDAGAAGLRGGSRRRGRRYGASRASGRRGGSRTSPRASSEVGRGGSPREPASGHITARSLSLCERPMGCELVGEDRHLGRPRRVGHRLRSGGSNSRVVHLHVGVEDLAGEESNVAMVIAMAPGRWTASSFHRGRKEMVLEFSPRGRSPRVSVRGRLGARAEVLGAAAVGVAGDAPTPPSPPAPAGRTPSAALDGVLARRRSPCSATATTAGCPVRTSPRAGAHARRSSGGTPPRRPRANTATAQAQPPRRPHGATARARRRSSATENAPAAR